MVELVIEVAECRALVQPELVRSGGSRGAGANFMAERFAVPGPVLVTPRRFGDHCGFFLEAYSARDFAALGIPDVFGQDNHSPSARAGTIRGLHFQLPPHAQAKLVRVLRGAILDIAVDIRRSSPHYGRHVVVVSDMDRRAPRLRDIAPAFG